ncbi:MAG: 50S ribosomal protein L16 [Candidatus Atabeyarchaeum deiterrae]|jgi:large subunit ribosomal protein L10e
MPQRPGRCYRDITQQSYTRKEYIRGGPQSKITIFTMGNKSAPKEEYPVQITLYAKEAAQIRHNALEAARQAANKYLSKKIGKDDFQLTVRVFPHHILRENKMMAFAGADRLQDGMKQSFGKAIGSAARVHPKQALITIRVKHETVEIARDALRRAAMKLPTPCRTEFDSE